jgi:hypothetical protein
MIIILFPYKFTNFFYKKYQINDLKKEFRNKIEIHDVSRIISKKRNKILDEKRNKLASAFSKISDWENYIKKILKKKKNIYVINLISSNSFKSFVIHYLLCKYKIKVLKLDSPEIYAPIQSYNLYLKLISFFKLLFFNLPRLKFVIRNFFYNKLLFFLKFDELYILVSGSKKYLKPSKLKSKKKKLINFHSSDYSNYLINKKKSKIKNFVVFLDTKTPAFIGDRQIFNFKINYNIEEWYKDLNIFLYKIEKEFKSEVIIIPHPTVRDKKNIYYDKKFKVSKDPDASNNLISRCKFVISISATTAVSYCVIYNKPLTFLYNNQLIKKNPSMYNEIKGLCNILSSGIININNNFKKNQINLLVDKKKYLNYQYNFMTTKKIKKLKNSEILKKLILYRDSDNELLKVK